ncbi:hypothetical protein FM119_12080 [Mycetocola reblochoni REB411]|uniref:Uncharacterized protein n=1 Tax=Mycetocola reblochoni REB411 TaxID=1255698 RepID=A0A1R4K9B8_9MICO|nr:hypothetical protein FM119_12080 [Mycetocola reblochoni REB411]
MTMRIRTETAGARLRSRLAALMDSIIPESRRRTAARAPEGPRRA